MYGSITFFTAAALSLAVGTVARAQEGTPTPDATEAHAEPAAAPATVQPGDRNCLRSTGSLIPAKPGECLPMAGRSYNQADIRRTGATNTADALRLLDPSITVHGH